MLILGIDPGLANTGYGIINHNGNSLQIVTYGCIVTSSNKEYSGRLNKIYDKVSELIESYKPTVMAVEELFFCKNAKTALNVGQARGVIILAGSKQNIKIKEYTPLQIKQAVTGFGYAKKDQVQEMVKLLLNLKKPLYPDDAADALAAAICCAHNLKTDTLERNSV
ncbi:MAG: crossover junction endodeoxyribonuclease RuvC [bacterium]|nr:crossover junction endodeoxyribonuclease RuvC [bacterium]